MGLLDRFKKKQANIQSEEDKRNDLRGFNIEYGTTFDGKQKAGTQKKDRRNKAKAIDDKKDQIKKSQAKIDAISK